MFGTQHRGSSLGATAGAKLKNMALKNMGSPQIPSTGPVLEAIAGVALSTSPPTNELIVYTSTNKQLAGILVGLFGSHLLILVTNY